MAQFIADERRRMGAERARLDHMQAVHEQQMADLQRRAP